jgi:hypothetical protein
MAWGETSRGRLRASDADREQVIDILKTAFVQGRLTQDELGSRAGQALASRTYAELAAVTADIPAGRIEAPSMPRSIQAATQAPADKRAVAWAACAMVSAALLGVAFLTFYGGFLVLFLFVFLGMTLTSTSPSSR